MQKAEFGFYILTCPRDFHLTRALVNSLKYFHPNIPIMIIPGTGMDLHKHPFNDIPILESSNSFLGKLDYYDRKFEIFSGPFEKFLYIDSDILCVKSIEKLINLILAEKGRFFYVNLPKDAIELNNSDSIQKNQDIILSGQLGNLENLKAFDSEYNFFNTPIFNSGLFASSKETLTLTNIIDFFNKEFEFYEKVLKKQYSGRNFDLFFGDQGKLNYLVWKNKISLKSLYNIGHYILGSEQFSLNFNDVIEEKNNFYFIHWAGCPRPSNSLFKRGFLFRIYIKIYSKNFKHLKYSTKTQNEIPGLDIWLYFNDDKTIKSIIKFSYLDIIKFFKYAIELPLRKKLKPIKQFVIENFTQSCKKRAFPQNS